MKRLFHIAIANRQTTLPVDRRLLRRAVREVLAEEGVASAEISLAIVDDATLQELHLRYLGEDSPTDVMSFVLERTETTLEGEVVVSADTAQRAAKQYGAAATDELLLYVIHGTLHLIGYRDDTRPLRAKMSAKQQSYVERWTGKPE